MITIRKNIREEGHCYTCKRVNYESSISPKIDTVSCINEIRINPQFPVYLCDECMNKLFDELAKFKSAQDKT